MQLNKSPSASSGSVPRKLAESDPLDTYLLKIPRRKLKRIKSIAQWYKDILNVKVSAAFLIREAIDDWIVKETRRIDKARRGRFHAKVRNFNNNEQ